jgi:DNA-binding PadR family transcriptional regulator
VKPLFDYLLLGLLLPAPKSGYDLRKVLQNTELAQFSDSPGSVYPALRRLERAGLIQPSSAGARGRTAYKLSGQGRSALADWARGRQTEESMRRAPQEFSVKYAFAEHLLSGSEILAGLDHHLRLLKQQERRLAARIQALPPVAPPSVREVLEQGLSLHRARHRWARSVRARHSEKTES